MEEQGLRMGHLYEWGEVNLRRTLALQWCLPFIRLIWLGRRASPRSLSLYSLLSLLPSLLFLCLTGKLTSQGQPSPRKAVCSLFKGEGSIFNQKRCITRTDEDTFYWTEDRSCQFESHLNTGKSMTVLSGISGGLKQLLLAAIGISSPSFPRH